MREEPAPADADHPFALLDPTRVIDALESTGIRCDGRLQALNSFENRVYLVGLEDADPGDGATSRVVKFYRPARWTDAQILEEHAFAGELAAHEIPIVAPLAMAGGDTLHHAQGFRFAVYPRQGGRVPALDNARDGRPMRERIGRFIARLHRLGEARAFTTRPRIDAQADARHAIEVVTTSGFLPPALEASWVAVAQQCAAACSAAFEPPPAVLRLHGDCHLGNLLWTDDGPHFVDLDDCRSGPAIQDLWMLADAGAEQADAGASTGPTAQMSELLDGYTTMRAFDARELGLIEPLRTLRMIGYSAWLAQRWHDPAFPAAFPWFGTERYWQDQILYLREQLGQLA
ncbi:MAG: serine/threonine protein kinase [Lautropia sp.]